MKKERLFQYVYPRKRSIWTPGTIFCACFFVLVILATIALFFYGLACENNSSFVGRMLNGVP